MATRSVFRLTPISLWAPLFSMTRCSGFTLYVPCLSQVESTNYFSKKPCIFFSFSFIEKIVFKAKIWLLDVLATTEASLLLGPFRQKQLGSVCVYVGFLLCGWSCLLVGRWSVCEILWCLESAAQRHTDIPPTPVLFLPFILHMPCPCSFWFSLPVFVLHKWTDTCTISYISFFLIWRVTHFYSLCVYVCVHTFLFSLKWYQFIASSLFFFNS